MPSRRSCASTPQGGTTAAALTTTAAPLAETAHVLATARRWIARKSDVPGGARLLGVHLEGPYFAPTRAGAHRPECVRAPAREEVVQLLEFADVITQMTLAPELPGALELIERLCALGIIASGGHSDAWEEDAAAARARGMSQVTHVFNAMSSARRRGLFRVAGLLEYALAEPALRCELIADGQHVSPTLMRLLYRAKGLGGICLITDASAGAGLPEGSPYRLAGRECVVRGGGRHDGGRHRAGGKHFDDDRGRPQPRADGGCSAGRGGRHGHVEPGPRLAPRTRDRSLGPRSAGGSRAVLAPPSKLWPPTSAVFASIAADERTCRSRRVRGFLVPALHPPDLPL